MMKKWCLLILCLTFVATAVFAAAAYGQDDGKDKIARGRADVDPKRVDKAVKKGVEWLKNRQQSDGHWEGKNLDKAYPGGVTALCLYALLKSEVSRDEDCIKNGFKYLKDKPFKTVYSVSTLILALTALYMPPTPQKAIEEEEKKPPEKRGTTPFEPYEKKLKKNFRKKAPPWVMDWLKKAVAWLIKQQQDNIWRYPGNHGAGPMEDASNTQYAVLALYSAMRVGVPVSRDVFKKTANYFLARQEPDGPDVKPFPVPAADIDISKLKQLEKEMLERMKLVAKQNKKIAEDAKNAGEKQPKLDSPTTTVVMENPYKKFGIEPRKMKARGWGYVAGKATDGMPEDMKKDWYPATGSMTTSGVAALVICKEQIEKGLKGKAKRKLNQAIRDGLAWIVHNWTVKENPKCGCWHLYYLYGVERAAVLSLCYKLGDHKWYKEGAEYLFGAQQGSGNWAAEEQQPSWNPRLTLGYGDEVSTCFAILFLKRATVPIIKPPSKEGTFTGEGLFGGGEKKK